VLKDAFCFSILAWHYWLCTCLSCFCYFECTYYISSHSVLIKCCALPICHVNIFVGVQKGHFFLVKAGQQKCLLIWSFPTGSFSCFCYCWLLDTIYAVIGLLQRKFTCSCQTRAHFEFHVCRKRNRGAVRRNWKHMISQNFLSSFLKQLAHRSRLK
jgi:hypothetical protein